MIIQVLIHCPCRREHVWVVNLLPHELLFSNLISLGGWGVSTPFVCVCVCVCGAGGGGGGWFSKLLNYLTIPDQNV